MNMCIYSIVVNTYSVKYLHAFLRISLTGIHISLYSTQNVHMHN